MSILGRITAFATPLFNFEKPITPTSLPAPANQSPTRSGAIATATLAVLVSGCSLNHTAVSWDDGMDATADISDDVDEAGETGLKDTGIDSDDVSDTGTDKPQDVTKDRPEDVKIEAAVDVTDEGIDNDVSDAGIDTPDTSIDLPDSGPVTDIPTDTPPDIISDGGIIDVPTDIPSDTSDASVPDSGIDVPTTDTPSVDVIPDIISVDAPSDMVGPDSAVDTGPTCTRPSNPISFLRLDTAASGVITSTHTGGDAPFGMLLGGTFVPGIIGQGVQISSDNEGIVANDATFGNFGTGNIAMSAWLILSTTAATSNRTIAARRGSSGFGWRIQPSGNMIFASLDSSCSITSTSPIPNDGRTHNVMFVRNSGMGTLYLDGSNVGTGPCGYNFTMGNPFYFGASQVGTSSNTNLPLRGVLDHFFAWVGTEASDSGAAALYCTDRREAGL